MSNFLVHYRRRGTSVPLSCSLSDIALSSFEHGGDVVQLRHRRQRAGSAVTETSSLLAANASISRKLSFQAGFTGTRVGGFHGTSLQSLMKCDVYACKELYAASRCLVARSFAGTAHFSPEQHESVTCASAKRAVCHVTPSNGTKFRWYTTLLPATSFPVFGQLGDEQTA